MKPHRLTKNFLNFYLKQLENKKGNKTVVEILKITLDENKTYDDIKKEIPRLQALAGIFESSLDAFHQKQDALEAIHTLGICFQHGFGITKDLKRAAELYQQAAEQEHARAQCSLGFCYCEGLGVSKDLKRAAELYQQAAEQGDADAQCSLGFCYCEGLGVTKDLKRAAELYQQATEQGHAGAQCSLGFCYCEGLGVTKDLKRATELFQQAAEQGDADAQCNLGFCYCEGLGVTKDLKRAAELYQQAAEQGDADAQCNLGVSYRDGLGVSKDLKRAIKLYQQAAEQGHAGAQCSLGFCYEQGLGINKDLKRATELYQRAAEQGHARAQCNLGICYNEDLGVTKDLKRATELFQQAAEQGYADAQFYLGICYEESFVTKDLKRAIVLCQAAVTKGQDNARTALPRLLAKARSPIPTLEEAVAYYSTNNDSAMLGFCYQLGLGTFHDLKQAVEYYTQAIQQGVPCLRDLFSCYQSMLPNLPTETLLDFYKDLETFSTSKVAALKQEALLELAYLYEKGAPHITQDLYKALKYYKKAEENIESKEKCEQYAILPALEMHLKEACAINMQVKSKEDGLYEENIASLIAEYAFEPKIKPMMTQKRKFPD